MRKQLLALSLILVMLLGITAQASGHAMLPAAQPSLSFSGTTASCRIIVRGDRSSDTLSATAKLWTGKTCLKTWTIKGTGKIQTTKTATVSKGKTYKLTVDYTVNGVKQPQKSVTRTCS